MRNPASHLALFHTGLLAADQMKVIDTATLRDYRTGIQNETYIAATVEALFQQAMTDCHRRTDARGSTVEKLNPFALLMKREAARQISKSAEKSPDLATFKQIMQKCTKMKRFWTKEGIASTFKQGRDEESVRRWTDE